jgi:hypothetical protein
VSRFSQAWSARRFGIVDARREHCGDGNERDIQDGHEEEHRWVPITARRTPPSAGPAMREMLAPAASRETTRCR